MEINSLSPSLINKKQSVNFASAFNELSDQEKKVLHNRKRGLRIANNARQNKDLYQTVCEYMESNELTTDEMVYFTGLRRSLQTCCTHSLYRKYHSSNHAIEYIGSQTCKHKICKVCNTERAKSLRRKYLAYFKGGMINRKTGEISQKEDFNYMHLTLTVPHTREGWNGKKWYANELIQKFNQMRKKNFWKEYVWGGEFGVEVTKNESGLHIHIHSLLIVEKLAQNRNKLHREILLEWNKLTADKTANRKAFTSEEKDAIKKGNKLITDIDINDLKPSGATLIGLESLYVLCDKKLGNNDKFDSNTNKWKHYIDASEDSQFMAGVLECLKYHFEPISFDKKSGIYDFDMLRELLPNIYRKPLYRKFGNLHGVQELNINENGIGEETKDAIEELGDAPTNPITGLQDSDFNYIICDAKNIYYDMMNKYLPTIGSRARQLHLKEQTLMQAVGTMARFSYRSQGKAPLRNDLL